MSNKQGGFRRVALNTIGQLVLTISIVVGLAALFNTILPTAPSTMRYAVVGALGGGVVGLVIFALIRRVLRGPKQLRKRVDTLLKTHFGQDQQLSQFWSGMVRDMRINAGGFVDPRQLYGPSYEGDLDVTIDEETVVSATPSTTATAFVHRYGLWTLHVIFFGNDKETPQPLSYPSHEVLKRTFTARSVRTKSLPGWAFD
jgi:hypothetical protein